MRPRPPGRRRCSPVVEYAAEAELGQSHVRRVRAGGRSRPPPGRDRRSCRPWPLAGCRPSGRPGRRAVRARTVPRRTSRGRIPRSTRTCRGTPRGSVAFAPPREARCPPGRSPRLGFAAVRGPCFRMGCSRASRRDRPPGRVRRPRSRGRPTSPDRRTPTRPRSADGGAGPAQPRRLQPLLAVGPRDLVDRSVGGRRVMAAVGDRVPLGDRDGRPGQPERAGDTNEVARDVRPPPDGRGRPHPILPLADSQELHCHGPAEPAAGLEPDAAGPERLRRPGRLWRRVGRGQVLANFVEFGGHLLLLPRVIELAGLEQSALRPGEVLLEALPLAFAGPQGTHHRRRGPVWRSRTGPRRRT